MVKDLAPSGRQDQRTQDDGTLGLTTIRTCGTIRTKDNRTQDTGQSGRRTTGHRTQDNQDTGQRLPSHWLAPSNVLSLLVLSSRRCKVPPRYLLVPIVFFHPGRAEALLGYSLNHLYFGYFLVELPSGERLPIRNHLKYAQAQVFPLFSGI